MGLSGAGSKAHIAAQRITTGIGIETAVKVHLIVIEYTN